MTTIPFKKLTLGSLEWNHLRHTRIAVEFARWNFILFISLKTTKIPTNKSDGYTHMLQMIPPLV